MRETSSALGSYFHLCFIFLTQEYLSENTCSLQQAASDVMALQTYVWDGLFSLWPLHLLIPKAVHSWPSSLRQWEIPVCWNPMACVLPRKDRDVNSGCLIKKLDLSTDINARIWLNTMITNNFVYSFDNFWSCQLHMVLSLVQVP